LLNTIIYNTASFTGMTKKTDENDKKEMGITKALYL